MKRVGLALVCAIGFLTTTVWAGSSLQVENAWVREGPPMAEVLGGFLQLRNPGPDAVTVTGVSSPAFERVEMHRSVIENGMAKMHRQESLVVPANGQLTLAPGGYHLMLFAPRQPLQAGQQVELVLHTAAGEGIAVHAEVRRGMGAIMNHHQH